VIFGQIAACEAVRASSVSDIERLKFRSDRYSSLTMAVAAGYILASMRQGVFDYFVALAVAMVVVGFIVKMAMARLCESSKESAGNWGGTI
jgi:hypothetical protein